MKLWTFREAARELETSEPTIRGLVRAHGIQVLPIHRNGNAKGLTRDHMAILRKALGRTGGRACRPATA